jgi:alkaline phosphatase D
VSGDLHSSWASHLTDRAGRPVAAEITVPAVSAPTFARSLAPPGPFGAALLVRLIRNQNRHVSWVDISHHGYAVLDITEERIEAHWWHVLRSDQRAAGERLAARAVLRHGDPTWRLLD